jgi:tetratricopeptide (TPR) repeat protein
MFDLVTRLVLHMKNSSSKLGAVTPLLITVGLIVIAGAFVVLTNKQAFFTSPTSLGITKLDTDIRAAEKVAATNPPLTKPYINLAELYLQKVRETVDSSYYAKVDTLMDAAAKIDPKDADVPAVRASVAMGRHLFKIGKQYTSQALALNAHTAAYFGLDGDADIELGKYQDAVDSFQKMVDIRPDFASWSRIAYIRELYGDIPGAQVALTQAISAGSSYPENVAWAYVEQGKLFMRSDVDAANTSFMMALKVLPTYTQAMEGLGKVAFAKGDMQGAEKEFTSAYSALALAQYAIDLGDLYGQEGNKAKASQQYALAQAAFDVSIKGGVDTDLEESLFLADHDLDAAKAVAMATRAHMDRPSEYGADYLSWALYKNGDTKNALLYTQEAFKLGKFDPLILFHQGMIAFANGDSVHAKEYLSKAYELNPNFSIQYVEVLKSSLAQLK